MPRLPRWFFPKARRKWNVRRALASRRRIMELEAFLRAHEPGPGMERMLRDEILAYKAMESDHLHRAERLHNRKKK